MKRIPLFISVAFAADVTPVQKVIEMLDGMLAKGKEAKHEEEILFASYKQWCDDSTREKKAAIEKAEMRVELLSADIQKYTSDANTATTKAQNLQEEIGNLEKDKEAAAKVRKIEREEYTETHKDYSESIDAVGRAVVVLQQQNFDRKQAQSFLSQAPLVNLMSLKQKRAIDKFLEEDPELADVGGPDAHGYEFQSGGVVDMLEKLKDKFVEERSTLEKDEANKRHAFQMLTQDLTAQVEQNKNMETNYTTSSGKKRQAAADATGELADTQVTLKDDTSFLNDTTSTCKIKSDDFVTRQQVRGEELEAIQKAIEILSGSAVSGAANTHLPSFLQARALLQVESRTQNFLHAGEEPRTISVNKMVQEYLLAQSQKLHSRVLSTLAMHVSDDPFNKVKKMINDLIVRLMAEANEEADHKGWCDKELTANQATRDDKTKATETLRAEIDQLTASISQNTDLVAELQVQITEQMALQSSAIEERKKEKGQNEATIKDAQDAQTAVERALTVLKEFYAHAGAFIQHGRTKYSSAQTPAIFGDEPYQGMGAESGGVVGLLEVIVSDFARLETETVASENQSDKEHSRFLSEVKVDVAQKRKDVEHKGAQKQNQEQALMEKKTDLDGTQKELDAALEYYEKLKPSCVDAGVSYEERVARRKEEIESLQEALRILAGEDLS